MKKGLCLTVCFLIIGIILLGLADAAFAADGVTRSILKTGASAEPVISGRIDGYIVGGLEGITPRMMLNLVVDS